MNIRLATKSTPSGARVPTFKMTAASPIEPAPLPETLLVPLQQNLGAPNRGVVKRGDKVLTGQKIADSDRFVSAPIHAAVSGEITGATTTINPPTGGVIDAFVITSDGQDKWTELAGYQSLESLTVEAILKRIREAGIVGAGGATFPTHVKLTPPKDKKIDTIILNGCECEPYITSDHRVMLEYGEKVLSGLNIIGQILSPKDIIIAIDDNKEDAIEHLEGLIHEKSYSFKIVPIKTTYPVGAEKVLVKMLLGREVPMGGLPLDVGVVVQNVTTAKALHDAIYEGKPFIERVVTVTGAVRNPKNLLVRFGTPIKNLIEFCGGITEEGGEVILGGPMMGISQYDLNYPVTKGTNCILVKAPLKINEGPCLSCGRCVSVCPVGLMPTLYPKYVKKGRWDDCKAAFVDNCFECGVCSYVCPANIPITQYIKVAKREIARRTVKK